MKKLFIITDVGPMDARKGIKAHVIGTVIRAELPTENMTANNDQLLVFPDRSAFGFAESHDYFWYGMQPDSGRLGMHCQRDLSLIHI